MSLLDRKPGQPVVAAEYSTTGRLCHGTELIELDVPALLVGDYNVMPTDLDVYAPERWRYDALFRLEVRMADAELVAKSGRMRSVIVIPASGYTHSGRIDAPKTRSCAAAKRECSRGLSFAVGRRLR